MRIAQASTLLFGFWLVLAGTATPLDIAVGAPVALLLGWWAARFLWPEDAPALSARQAVRFALYVPRLLGQVVRAAFQVAEVVLDPRLPLEPVTTWHRTSFSRTVTRTAYANSITLTPGTLTVDLDGDAFFIHCLAERFADDIATGELERKISRVFEE